MSASKVDNEPAPGVYAPRRSQRVSSTLAPSDGDIWQEKLAVCEGVTVAGEPRLLIRSFYLNSRTTNRVWDEPPSGAGTVLHATSDMRKTAEMKKEELQMTLEMIPPDEAEGAEDNIDKVGKAEKKPRFLDRFRKKKEPKQVETSKDLNLQRAIARSLNDQKLGNSDDPIVYYDGESNERFTTLSDEEEEIALAKALSMSESTAQNSSSDPVMEEEMFQRAMEHSRSYTNHNAATGVASMPSVLEESFSSYTMSPQVRVVGKRDPNESDQKLPTIPMKFEP